MNSTGKRLIRIGWILAGMGIVSVVAYFFFLKKTANKVEINSDKIIHETLIKKVSATGTIRPVQTVEVGTQVSGTISKLYADFNSIVKAGQIIAKMDTRTLAASVKESEASLAKAEAQLNQSKRVFDRTGKLFKEEVVPIADFEKAEEDYLLALATYKSVKLQLERNRVNLDLATIKSPIDGIVISRKVDEGQTVAAAFSTPTFYVIANDLKKMKIEASVDEADIGEVKVGQSAEFTVDAFPDKIFNGKVELVQLEPTTIQNVVTYIVEIIIDNKDMKLIPGMTANLDIVVAKKENVLSVSNGALAFVMNDDLAAQIKNEGYEIKRSALPGKKTIWIHQDKALVEKAVVTGYSNGVKTEINGEVKAGDDAISSVEIVDEDKKPSRSFLMPQNQRTNNKTK